MAGRERAEDVQDLKCLTCEVVLKYKRSPIEGSEEAEIIPRIIMRSPDYQENAQV